ncbi:MAG TPA: pantoate--beta-alanine ligase [Flavisolibacter sp.]
MIIFKRASEITDYLSRLSEEDTPVGFVPTMGALHEGHLSLLDASRKQNSVTVCSIFINPSQFNNPEDFRLYPVTVEKDIEMLIAHGCDVLFLPPVEEIYPPGYVAPAYDLGAMEHVLEGHYRPGHFQGVCQVVDRLLDIISPDRIYLGQKDFQQCMVIKKLLELTGKNARIQIQIMPTIREADGLAMSSRNLRLNEDERRVAPALFHELSVIRAGLPGNSIEQLEHDAYRNLENNGFSVDYIKVVNANSLAPAQNISEPLVAVAAASIGGIRLIDNLILN